MKDNGISIDVKQIKRLEKKFGNLDGKLFNKKVLLHTATKQKFRLLARTDNGKDTENRPFKPYNATYAKLAEKLNVSSVNLTATGGMLNSITQNATEKEANIFFTNDRAEELASFHDQLGAGKNKVIRKFFGFNDDDKNSAYKDYVKGIRKDLDKEGFK